MKDVLTRLDKMEEENRKFREEILSRLDRIEENKKLDQDEDNNDDDNNDEDDDNDTPHIVDFDAGSRNYNRSGEKNRVQVKVTTVSEKQNKNNCNMTLSIHPAPCSPRFPSLLPCPSLFSSFSFPFLFLFDRFTSSFSSSSISF